MEQEKVMTIEDLQAENASLKKENARLNRARANLIDKNQELGEFIRVQLTDILAIAKHFRDEYENYAKFVQQVTQLEVNAIGAIPNEHTGETNI